MKEKLNSLIKENQTQNLKINTMECFTYYGKPKVKFDTMDEAIEA